MSISPTYCIRILEEKIGVNSNCSKTVDAPVAMEIVVLRAIETARTLWVLIVNIKIIKV